MVAPITEIDRESLRFLLDRILAEASAGRLKQEETSGKIDALLEKYQKFTDRLLKLYERQRQDRQRIERLERTVFYGAPAPLARPTTPIQPFPPPGMHALPPPPPSADDSAVHDLAEMRAELGALKAEDERKRRRDSWRYRKTRSVLLAIAAALAIAVISAAATWLASHVRLGARPLNPRSALVRR